jgi:hypothetical protein
MAENKDDYAIVIGIDTYSRLFRLRSAHADAISFARWLTSANGGGLPEENVRILLGPPEPPLDLLEAQPAQRHIDNRFEQMGIERNERIGRRLYFYFAGHGFGPEFDNIGMLLIDASESNLNSNIGLWQYRQFFKNHDLFDEIVYIIDCCRDPAPPTSGLQLRGPSFTLTDKQTRAQDYVVLAAAYGEKAYAVASSDKGERRGLLTRALLEGLEKAHDGLGRITSASVRDYVLHRVPELVEELREVDKRLKNQKPEILALPDPPIVFATIPSDQRFKVHIIAGSHPGGNLVLFDGNATRLETKAASAATAEQPWELELPRNSLVYVVEHDTTGQQIPILPRTVVEEPHIVTF